MNETEFKNRLLEEGFSILPVGKGETTLAVTYAGRRLAYMNPDTRRRGAVVGYQFLRFGIDSGGVPANKLDEHVRAFVATYGVEIESLIPWVGSGSNASRGFLFIKDPSVAIDVLWSDRDYIDNGLRELVGNHIVRKNSSRVLENSCPRENFRSYPPLTLPAAKAQQGDLLLYTTTIAVRYLVQPGFYSVETLDPENSSDKGYQRLLNHARARKLADYIVQGQESRDAFLPTSVFLATDKSLPYDGEQHQLRIDIERIGAFSVVDGQHRLEGLKLAAEKDSRVLDFEIPVNIAANLPRIQQMAHFLIVNTTQKSVDKSVEQRIVARLTEALDVEDLPSLPKWILNTVQKGEVDKAVKYVDFLNDTPGSPWYQKIRMANADQDETTVNQRSFVKAIVKYVLTANNPLGSIIKDFDKERRIFLNYWKAIATLLDDGEPTVLYKYSGVELFCKFSIPFFVRLQDRGNFTESCMESWLRACFDGIEGEFAGVGHPDWWKRGSTASRMNAAALSKIAQEMTLALHRSSVGAGTIQL